MNSSQGWKDENYRVVNCVTLKAKSINSAVLMGYLRDQVDKSLNHKAHKRPIYYSDNLTLHIEDF